LPNTLVDGAGDEVPPLELLRQSHDPDTLRLLLELYRSQRLDEEGGIDRRQLRTRYTCETLGRSEITSSSLPSRTAQW
jgi:hypothetical protein